MDFDHVGLQGAEALEWGQIIVTIFGKAHQELH